MQRFPPDIKRDCAHETQNYHIRKDGGCIIMYTTKIFLRDLTHVKQFAVNVKNFAAMTAKYDKLRINLISDIYTIDAHSLIGIISLDITNPMILELPDENPSEEFLADLQPFAFDEVLAEA